MATRSLLSGVVSACLLSGVAAAQNGMVQPDATVGGGGQSTPVVVEVQNPDDPIVQAYAATQKRRVEQERELYKIRAQYIRGIRNTEIRQIGIMKIREFTDPAVFPSLLKIFEREGEDVRLAILDHLADQKTNQGDATLAWAAVFDDDKAHRAAAADRLIRRTNEVGEVPSYVRSTIAKGLKDGTNDQISAAAELAGVLELVDAIPMLINAQIGGGTTAAIGGGGRGDGALAYILVGQQQAFVSDLEPVVADSAVGFDPEISVVTEGVILRVIDAVVLTYRVEVHNALVGLSSKAWGRPTNRLGWDNRAWQEWYVKEFQPHWAKVQAEKVAAAKAAEKPAGPG